PVGLELLFTTSEEPGLRGAKAFDQSRLRADYGFVFDHATPIGELVTSAPTFYRIEAQLHGASAHAGIRPEDGRNAIAAAAAALARLEFGRLDAKTTANVGLIEGGTAVNVVPERCRVVLETRSLDDARASEVAQGIVDAFTEAASDAECDVDTNVEQQFRAYSLARTSAPVALASAALEARGIEPQFIATGSGGFDVVHVNLTRGLDGSVDPAAHVMKLNYTSLQHGVVPLEGGVTPRQTGDSARGKPVAVLALHGQLPCVAWAAARAAPEARI